MIGLLLESLGALLVVVATVRALVVSAREKFALGTLVGGARLVLALVVGWAIVRFIGVAPPAPLGLLIGIAQIAGPIFSIATVFVAWRRFQDVPAVDEARLERPFDAWLPVAILDAFWAVILIGAAVLLAGS
jgi:hypothetical protein